MHMLVVFMVDGNIAGIFKTDFCWFKKNIHPQAALWSETEQSLWVLKLICFCLQQGGQHGEFVWYGCQ